ncbi:hypothetical protein [Acetobacter malorum]|uniref:hypothetical protein n=1 Tax=Acetobacter malorum TaxID=178901 RepID=UPI00248EC8B4|nr:hypothetical protein [Acetobacter malorum]
MQTIKNSRKPRSKFRKFTGCLLIIFLSGSVLDFFHFRPKNVSPKIPSQAFCLNNPAIFPTPIPGMGLYMAQLSPDGKTILAYDPKVSWEHTITIWLKYKEPNNRNSKEIFKLWKNLPGAIDLNMHYDNTLDQYYYDITAGRLVVVDKENYVACQYTPPDKGVCRFEFSAFKKNENDPYYDYGVELASSLSNAKNIVHLVPKIRAMIQSKNYCQQN